jgi:hypothetical protein
VTKIRFWIYTVGILLTITSVAKFLSACGNARILESFDPIFSVSFRHVFWVVGFIELAVALACFSNKHIGLQVRLVAWLSTSFLAYRLGLVWIGYQKPCSCLGNLTDALHIPPQTADMAMKIILAYLLIGSYASLFWLWRQHRNAEGRMMNVEVKQDKAP